MALGCAMLMLLSMARSGANLVANPEFNGLTGWGPMWARQAGTASAQIVNAPNGRGVEVVATGTDDWSLGQMSTVDVRPGQVYRISAKLRATNLNSAEISVVTYRANDQAIDWSYGAARTTGTHDWKSVTRRFVIPEGCDKIQFRLIGYGKGTVAMAEPVLQPLGTVKPTTQIPKVTLQNPASQLIVSGDGTITFSDKRNGRKWQTKPLPTGYVTESLEATSKLTAKAKVTSFVDDTTFTLTYILDPKKPEASMKLDGNSKLQGNLSIPGAWKTAAKQWLILPMNEGILFPTDDPTVQSMSLVTYGGHGICMPWFGIVDPHSGAGVMTRFATPDDASIWMDRHGSLLDVSPQWEPSRGELRYGRKIVFSLFDQGGYVAMAKAYRQIAKASGLFKTLAEKRKDVPYVDRLVGAINVWNWDMPKVDLCKELKQMGFEHVLWSGSGTAEEIRQINDLGYLSSRYDIYQDVWDPKTKLDWMPSAGWPEDLVWLPDGELMKGWTHPQKQPDGTTKFYEGGVICSERGLARAKTVIPEELSRIPFHCRFIDTTTASPWRECYNPAHPLSRSDDRKYKMALLAYVASQKLVVGSETGIDPSVPSTSYYEGMMSLGPYRLPDAGTDMLAYRKPTPEFLKYQVGSFYRLPLWELVYHDCVVAQWYWGDATNKAPEVWDQRDLLNILYGTAPLLMMDRTMWERDKTRMKQTYDNVCRWTRKIGYDEMLSHEYLTADHTVQRTRFAGGRSVIVNFGDKPYLGVAPKSFKTVG